MSTPQRRLVGPALALTLLAPALAACSTTPAGDHRLICIATAPEPITASIEDSGR